MKLAPSILAADLADLAQAVRDCEAGGADLLHLDVMDGHFVPNLSFGIPVVEAVKRRTSLPLDVHLMVANPERLLDAYLAAGAAWVSVHWEAALHLDRLMARIQERGARAGVALNPATPVELLTDLLPRIDFVLLMSVNPGFSGQEFLPHVVSKARRLKGMIEQAGLSVKIEMDGGIGRKNFLEVAASGVDMGVVGSGIFADDEPVQTMKDLRGLAGPA